MTEALPYLRRLVAEQRYLFHGSPHAAETLEPRQAFHDMGRQPDLNQFGVYATTSFRIALLYAVIHEKRTDWGWRWDPHVNPSELSVVAPSRFNGGAGYLYILDRREFEPCGNNSLNYICRKSVIPLERLEVQPRILEDLQRECEVVIYLPGTI